MITHIEAEKGGELDGYTRIELSLPLTEDELYSLQSWLNHNHWCIEVEQIDDYLNGKDWKR